VKYKIQYFADFLFLFYFVTIYVVLLSQLITV